ncbi:MAG TPA: sugar kinase [Dongiaceae bacterium]|nr:sugar kinase [Dongiaceae bacterium]
MLELSGGPGSWMLGYGGDTLNTAIHLARAGHHVAFLTALGDDPFSLQLRRQWLAEGLDGTLMLQHPRRHAGLYAISVDAAGERSFTYWRENSAAREMFSLPETAAAVAAASTADLLYFSLITMAILPPEGRARLLALAKDVRSIGGKVAFDGNYRPRLWDTPAEAMAARDAAIGCADIGLPSLDDEAALSGASGADEVEGHWTGLGCAEVVVKDAAFGCHLAGGDILAPPAVLAPVDTSGAGDAFNAGYLGARMKGANVANAAAAGHALAGWTIMRPGAIPPVAVTGNGL